MNEAKPFVRVEGSITITFPYSERESLQMTREEAWELYTELGYAIGTATVLKCSKYPEEAISGTATVKPVDAFKVPSRIVGHTLRGYGPKESETGVGTGPPD